MSLQVQSNREMLRRVLCAYSLRNSTVGYCQSMNYIAGLLLLVPSRKHNIPDVSYYWCLASQIGVPEESAFWLLTTIVEELLADYFVPTIRSLRVDLRVFADLVTLLTYNFGMG